MRHKDTQEIPSDNPMDAIPSESIWSNNDIVIPMADVQHIEKHYHDRDLINPPNTKKGDLMGILIITKHTHWDMVADAWSNPIWLKKEEGEQFIKDWCYYRYEVEMVAR